MLEDSKQTQETEMKANTVGLDIETFPFAVYSWVEAQYSGSWRAIRTITPSYIMCVGIKINSSKTRIYSIHHYKGTLAQKERKMLVDLRKVLDEAFIAYGWNSDKFDIKKLNAKMLEYGLPPYSPVKQIDVMKEWNKLAKDGSSSLNNVLKRLGYEPKLDSAGFDTWLGYHNGVLKDIRRMDSYCSWDVDQTKKVLDHLKPWMKTFPNMNVVEQTHNTCPRCRKSGTLRVNKRNVPRGKRLAIQYICAPARGGCGAYPPGPLVPLEPNKKILIG